MIEPTLALQTAIGDALAASPAVTALVPAGNIVAGPGRPENFPAIDIKGAQTIFLGNAAGSQYLARAFLDIHIFAQGDNAETVKAIGFAMSNVLKEAPDATGFSFDEFSLPSIRWMRDPDPMFTHGVLTVECVIRWSI